MSEALFPIKTLRAGDALWICQTDLLRCLDSEARGTWRLVCKSACKAVEDNTRCLTWKERGLNEKGTGRKAIAQDYDENQAILQKCPALEKVCGLYPEAYQHLAGLPISLRALEILCPSGLFDLTNCLQHGHPFYMSATAALPKLDAADLQRVDWSPLTRLTSLEEAVLQRIPASSTMLPSMGMCFNPSAAAVMMMAFSSVAVVSNSLLLRARNGLGESLTMPNKSMGKDLLSRPFKLSGYFSTGGNAREKVKKAVAPLILDPTPPHTHTHPNLGGEKVKKAVAPLILGNYQIENVKIMRNEGGNTLSNNSRVCTADIAVHLW
eukprot:gene32101-biopygen9579